MSDTIYFIMEIIGTVAFSISGAIIGVQKKMDILGVIILGVVTAVGGGVVRDIILGTAPPAAFTNPIYCLLAAITAVIVFIPSVRFYVGKGSHKQATDWVLLIMDSMGLGVFTVIGVKAGYSVTADFNMFLIVFLGVVTGVGGGVIRDLFAQEPPYIFHKHFYACASIIGAIVCAIMWEEAGDYPAMLTGTICVIVLRLAAARYRWKLPRAK